MILNVFICFTAILFSSARHRAGAGERGTATCQGLKNVPMISLHIGFQWFGGIFNFLIKLKLNLHGTQNVPFSAFFWKSWNLDLCHVFQPLLSLWGRHTSSLLGGTGPGMGLGSETKLCYIAENHIEDRWETLLRCWKSYWGPLGNWRYVWGLNPKMYLFRAWAAHVRKCKKSQKN